MPFEGWSPNEFRMFDELNMPDSAFNDGFIQGYFDNALFDFDHALSQEEHAANLEGLREYLWDEYGLDFDDVFDAEWWEDYRELYDTSGA
jgi:hypothetical protein